MLWKLFPFPIFQQQNNDRGIRANKDLSFCDSSEKRCLEQLHKELFQKKLILFLNLSHEEEVPFDFTRMSLHVRV